MRILFFTLFASLPQLLSAQSSQELVRSVNSAFDEMNPVFSPDGTTLYLTVGNHPENTGGKKDPGDIWISRKTDAGWSVPVHGGPLLNDKGYNAVAGLSVDGDQLFLHGHYGSAQMPARTQGIAVARRNAAGWSRPENITIPYFMNKSGLLCGALSADSRVFVFSAESYGTRGVDDIYVTVKRDGKWSEPWNLGNVINTQFQELSPSLSDDMSTLYFSSNGRKGHGSFDVYASRRQDDSWTNWSTPVNLGPDVNSEGRELFYRDYPSLGFSVYTSTTSSDGYGDVRLHTPAPQEMLPISDTAVFASTVIDQAHSPAPPPTDQKLAPEASAEKVAPEKLADVTTQIKLHGMITNAKTGEAIPARISFEAPDLVPITATAASDGFLVGVPPARYNIRIESPGFVSTLERLDISAFETRDLEINFRLQPVELGTTVNLKNVLFAQAKTDILPESYPELDVVVSFLKENPTVRIELMGHTDGRGVHADNVRLSQQRVSKVKEYLVSRGIEPRRITGKGFGGSKPIASNDTEESRRKNRRVEFVIRKF